MGKRCGRCLLPTKFPGLTFNEEGVCSACRSHTPPATLKGIKGLVDSIERNRGQAYDCIIPLSGGKDSSYVLYFISKVLGFRPIAVNYDSGFQSKTAKENIERACEKLNVPLIRYKADQSIRERILKAVIHITDIVDIPFGVCGNCEAGIRSSLFKLGRAEKVRLIIYGDSAVENVDMEKIPFAGAKKLIRSLNLRKIPMLPMLFGKLAGYTFLMALERKKFGLPTSRVCNPYREVEWDEKNYKIIHFFDYVRWSTMDKEKLLFEEIGWRAGGDRVDRFDCLLHPLDNLKWLKEAGITKDGYIYSRMVREGEMSREEALNREESIIRKIKDDCQEIIERLGFKGEGVKWLEFDELEIGGPGINGQRCSSSPSP
jgi:3'-phosphoadenosine 5'-phosphosulfate sulfotransferase (PAPS reductase)/FAD synthetase